MNNFDYIRKLEVNATAMKALAAFTEFESDLDISDQYAIDEAIQEWVLSKGQTWIVAINELLETELIESDVTPQDFVIGMSFFAMSELTRVLPQEYFVELLYQMGGIALLQDLGQAATEHGQVLVQQVNWEEIASVGMGDVDDETSDLQPFWGNECAN